MNASSMLDRIVWENHPGQVYAVEWHVSSSYPLLYSAEGRAKWRQYPPPYNGGYATPWCWVDGRNASYLYNYWEAYVSDALTYPTDLEIRLTGSYDPGTRSGQIQAELVNEGPVPISANAYVVITEDSINYTGPNGDPWHNHVCRDYVPTETGTPMTIPAQGRDTLVQDFVLQPSWNQDRCNVLVYFQDPVVGPDSSKLTHNAAQVRVADITGVAEPTRSRALAPRLRVVPNPCRGRAVLEFSELAVSPSVLEIYAADGARVRTLRKGGVRSPKDEARAAIAWDCTDDHGRVVPGGVYVVRLKVGGISTAARVVVSD